MFGDFLDRALAFDGSGEDRPYHRQYIARAVLQFAHERPQLRLAFA